MDTVAQGTGAAVNEDLVPIAQGRLHRIATDRNGGERTGSQPHRPQPARGKPDRVEGPLAVRRRSEEHTSELPSLMRISYAVFCLNKKKKSSTEQSTRHSVTHIIIIN